MGATKVMIGQLEMKTKISWRPEEIAESIEIQHEVQ